jgi:diaminopimelate decarboxylase
MHDGDGITFEKIANVLNSAINNYFSEDIRIIAEPGRYYAAPAFTIAAQVIARRGIMKNQGEYNEAGEGNSIGGEKTDDQAFMCKCCYKI